MRYKKGCFNDLKKLLRNFDCFIYSGEVRTAERRLLLDRFYSTLYAILY